MYTSDCRPLARQLLWREFSKCLHCVNNKRDRLTEAKPTTQGKYETHPGNHSTKHTDNVVSTPLISVIKMLATNTSSKGTHTDAQVFWQSNS